MAELARLHGSGALAQIEHLARTEAVPANFLAQILVQAARPRTDHEPPRQSRAVTRWRVPPEEISLHDILVAVEGGCLHLSGNFQGRSGRRLKQVWDEIGRALWWKKRRATRWTSSRPRIRRRCITSEGAKTGHEV